MLNIQDQGCGQASVRWLQEILHERLSKGLMVFAAGNYVIRAADRQETITLDADSTFFAGVDPEQRVAEWDAKKEGFDSVLGKRLPAPGASSLPSPLIEFDPSGSATIHYDILGLTYWMLTRQEEVGSTELDEHGRFPARASHAFKHGYLDRPIVDEWLAILGQVMQRVWPGLELEQHAFQTRVSHDVDAPSRYLFRPWRTMTRAIAGDLIRRKTLSALWQAPRARLTRGDQLPQGDSLNTFDWLMDVSERHGLQSAFYFICARRPGVPNSADYDLGHPAIRHLIRSIHGRGHEIGLHPSYQTFLEPEQIKREADHLRRVCAEERVQQAEFGGRMHYLQWRNPMTLRAWEAAGMAYDSTLTYADCAGFRCGTCFEYPAFDPVAQQPLALRIRPLVVMEGSVFGAKYMNLGMTPKALEHMVMLKERCRQVKGQFTLLWHNSSFPNGVAQQMYQDVLAA